MYSPFLFHPLIHQCNNWQTPVPSYTDQSHPLNDIYLTQTINTYSNITYPASDQTRYPSMIMNNDFISPRTNLLIDKSTVPTDPTSSNQSCIPTLVTQRHYNNHHNVHNKNNLRYVETKKFGLKVAVFNAHSVQRQHRRYAILEFIRDEHIDIMFLTET